MASGWTPAVVGRGPDVGHLSARRSSGEAALRVLRSAGEADERSALLHAIVTGATQVVGADRGIMFLRSKSTSSLFHGVAGVGHLVDEEAVGLVCGGLADRFSREIVANRAPVAVQNATNDPRTVRSAMRRFEAEDILGVPLIADDEVVGLLFVEEHGVRREYTVLEQQELTLFGALAVCALRRFDESAELRETNARLDRRAATLGRSAVIDRRFTALGRTTPDADAIATLTATLTEKSCSISTVEGTPVAGSSPDGVGVLVLRVLEPHIASTPEVARVLGSIEPGRSAIVDANVNCNLLHRSLVAPVTIDDETWGHIAIMESRSRLTLTDQFVIERAAAALELELRIERRLDGSSNGAGVLRTDYDATQIQRTVDELLAPMPATFVVCRIEPRGTSRSAGLDGFEASFADHFGAAPILTYAAVGGILVLVVGLPDDVGPPDGIGRITESLDATLEGLVGARALVATVSTIRRSAEHVHHAYEEARLVAHTVTSLCSEDIRVVSASALGVGRLVLGAVDRPALERFVTLELGALTADRRDPREAELLRTLYVFIESSRSPRLAAQALNVHENTVRYRLRRIAELTGLDVAGDAQDQLTAQVAMLVLRLQGRIPGYDVLGRPTTGRSVAP